MSLIIGSNGNDIGAFSLYGTDQADLLLGLNGIDQLSGQGGDDVLQGGLGDDLLFGGAGSDTASYAYSAYGVSVDLEQFRGTVQVAVDDQDALFGIENVVGSSMQDLLQGDAGANVLSGGNGFDQLEGRGGADRLEGGAGEDHAYYGASAAGVNVNLATGKGSGGDAQGDTLFGVEHLHGSAFGDQLTGNGGDNALFGNQGNDTLKGGGGADLLSGDAGRDELWGGDGADRFVFHEGESAATKANADTIHDFGTQSDDKIDLFSFGENNPGLSFGWGFTFVGKAAFTGEHQVRAISEGGDTLIGLNVTGTTGAEMWIRLEGAHALQADDFLL